MFEVNWRDEVSRRCSLPTLNSFTFRCESERQEDPTMRRLPPLPRVEPLPPGPFNSNAFTPTSCVQSPPSSQDAFPSKSAWLSNEQQSMVSPPSPASSVEFSLKDTFSTQKAFGWPNDLSYTEIMALVAPRNINRKPPLQQLCGRKRKSEAVTSDQDDQREKHRIAEGNRRKNLSQLHRELDSRVHDFFLERAGWNPGKSLPQSKEHIVQGAVFLIDFMLAIIVHLLRQEKNNNIPPQLSENLQAQLRSMQLQQQVASLQSQNQATQSQMRTLKQEYDELLERYRALEFKLKSYDQVFFRSPKLEVITPPPPLATIPESEPQSSSCESQHEKKVLPGLRVFCDEIAALSPGWSEANNSNNVIITGGPQNLEVISRSMMSPTRTMSPTSPMCLTPSFSQQSLPSSRRESVNHTI